MKKLILLMLVCSINFAVTAQSKNPGKQKKEVVVPVVIKESFKKEYPGIDKVKWDAENNDFEAEFKLNGVETSATYNATGHKTETETEIATSALPAESIAYLEKNYAAYKITEAAKIVNDKNEITFEAELKKAKESMDALFTEKGQFIKIVHGD